jgi:anaerobic ribonucleoside-triphosphate reductase activating protein
VPQTLALRGSDNQRLVLLTDRGRARFAGYDRPTGPNDKVLDVMLDDDGTAWLAGVPHRRDLRRLAALLGAQGHRVAVSEARAHAADRGGPT